MSDEPKPTEPKKPGPYDKVNSEEAYRGYDPSKPQRFRDPKNRRRHGPQNTIADGVTFGDE